MLLIEITKTKNKKKKSNNTKMCFLIEQKQLILQVTTGESPDILWKKWVVCIIQVLAEEQKCLLLGMYCCNIFVTRCHLVHHKTNHVAFQRYLFIVLPKNMAADRMGQFTEREEPMGSTDYSRIPFSKVNVL